MEKNFGIIDKAIVIYSAHTSKTGETFRAPDRLQCRVEKISGNVQLVGYDGSLIASVHMRIGKVVQNPHNEADQELIRLVIEDYRAECKRRGISFGSPIPEHCRVDRRDQKVVLYNGSRIVGVVFTGSPVRKGKVVINY